MNISKEINELATALASAQEEITNAEKNALNPHFRSQYADLASILNTVRPVLAKHAIAIVQMPSWENGKTSVNTRLIHKSGQYIESTLTCNSDGMAQRIGASITYLRRYGLAAMVGISQEDDDGESLDRQETPMPPAIKDSRPISDAQHKRLEARIKELNLDRDVIKNWIKNNFGVDHFPDLNREQYERLDRILDRKQMMPAKKGETNE